MKKSKVLSTPTRLKDLSFEDLDNDDASLKAERISTRKWRQFKQDAA